MSAAMWQSGNSSLYFLASFVLALFNHASKEGVGLMHAAYLHTHKVGKIRAAGVVINRNLDPGTRYD